MTFRLFTRTLPYVAMRALVFLAFGMASILFVAVMLGIGFLASSLAGGAGGVLVIVALVALGGLWGLAKLAKRYLLYLVKIGHVAVVTELVVNGTLPEGANQFTYGKDKVVRHFGGASALFAVDQVLSASVQQILSWLTSLGGGCLIRVPGLQALGAIARRVLSIAANYIDEAVMSYILQRGDENVWQAAADGVVLYAQSWKRLLTTAAVLAALVSAVWVVGFVLFLLAGLATYPVFGGPAEMDRLAYGLIVALPALFLASIFQWLLVDPLATVAMVVTYNKAIAGQTPAVDLYAQLQGVSSSFRQLSERAVSARARSPQIVPSGE
ncbi:MAG TPA: hypothetical protein GX714_00770 [Chloroflexi bacterium]|jgi:hypothetical protein|nr:hypothetical protein [Chloroflexota bacterium]